MAENLYTITTWQTSVKSSLQRHGITKKTESNKQGRRRNQSYNPTAFDNVIWQV